MGREVPRGLRGPQGGGRRPQDGCEGIGDRGSVGGRREAGRPPEVGRSLWIRAWAGSSTQYPPGIPVSAGVCRLVGNGLSRRRVRRKKAPRGPGKVPAALRVGPGGAGRRYRVRLPVRMMQTARRSRRFDGRGLIPANADLREAAERERPVGGSRDGGRDGNCRRNVFPTRINQAGLGKPGFRYSSWSGAGPLGAHMQGTRGGRCFPGVAREGDRPQWRTIPDPGSGTGSPPSGDEGGAEQGNDPRDPNAQAFKGARAPGSKERTGGIEPWWRQTSQ